MIRIMAVGKVKDRRLASAVRGRSTDLSSAANVGEVGDLATGRLDPPQLRLPLDRHFVVVPVVVVGVWIGSCARCDTPPGIRIDCRSCD